MCTATSGEGERGAVVFEVLAEGIPVSALLVLIAAAAGGGACGRYGGAVRGGGCGDFVIRVMRRRGFHELLEGVHREVEGLSSEIEVGCVAGWRMIIIISFSSLCFYEVHDDLSTFKLSYLLILLIFLFLPPHTHYLQIEREGDESVWKILYWKSV